MIIENILLSFFIGTIIGVVLAWNKKAYFILWILSVIFSIYNLYNGMELNLNSRNISNCWYILFIISMIIGVKTGEIFYNDVFKK